MFITDHVYVGERW